MLSFNAILVKALGVFLCFGNKADTQLALRLLLFYLPTDVLFATMRQTFDLFPMSGRVVWMEFLIKFTAKVQALRVS